MPYGDPDPTDPSTLVGTAVDCTRDQIYEMAAAFASELAQMGHDESRILSYFRRESYAGPNLAWETLGEPVVRELVSEAVAFWSRCRFVTRDPSKLLSIGRTKS